MTFNALNWCPLNDLWDAIHKLYLLAPKPIISSSRIKLRDSIMNLILWNRPLDMISLVDLLLYRVSLIDIIPFVVSVISISPIVLVLIIIIFPTGFPRVNTAFSLVGILIIPVLMLWLVKTNNFPMSEI
ncbi:hypothetical protein HanIR_Chr03g0108871 [Helianthus annuus]|nr:hypothetical protein HanIR_Chr03g0108871 [Helianthus annuus]